MDPSKKARKIRKSLDLQQKQLAYILNVTPAALCRWERKAATPKGGNMQLIDILYLNIRKTTRQDLAEIATELHKVMRFASPAGCLNTLLHDLIAD